MAIEDLNAANNTVSGAGVMLSDAVIRIFEMGNWIVCWASLVTSALGIIGNILTLVVYAKLGFSETIHMSYTAMAVSDLACILTLMYISLISISPVLALVFAQLGLKANLALFGTFTGSWPLLAFSRTTAFLTAWVSFERCLSVIYPTKVKLIVTPRVTKIIIASIYVIGCFPLILIYINLKTELRFNPISNYSTFLMYVDDDGSLSGSTTLAYSLLGVVYPVVSWTITLVCTTFLIVRLKQSANWRKANTQAVSAAMAKLNGRKNSSRRETRVTRTVVTIACVFVACTLPISVNVVIRLLFHEFSMTGALMHASAFYGVFSFFLSGVNSSINIIIYSATGSKFRSTLYSLFLKKRRQNWP